MSQQRILVVDDEVALRSVIVALLERSGYDTVAVEDADAAIACLQQGSSFDLILTDIMMPGTDGIHLLHRVCAEHPGTPVVMVTAMQDVHVATNAFRSGAIDYLLKPFTREQLVAVVSRALEQARLMRKNTAYRQNLEDLVDSRTMQLRATMEDLERSYDTTLEAMGNALDLRDEETEGHSKRVTAYTIALARAMQIDAEQLKTIARGAFLHDLGKIATPDHILRKPGKLDAEEMAIMREHCRHGYEMVCKIPFLKDAAEIVLSHQERFDGQGYPRGLRGEQIPLGARIFALADTLDAMTSDRPYRKGTSFAMARDEIARCAGTQFDPAIVEVFLSIPVESWSELREEIARLSPAVLSARLCRPAVAYAA